MISKAVVFASVSALAVGLAACGGGGGGTGGGGTPPITVVPTTTPVVPGHATTSVSVRIPGAAAAGAGQSSSQRRPQFISPGTDKLSFFVDGAGAFTDVQVDSAPQPYVSGDGNTKATYGCVAGGDVW